MIKIMSFAEFFLIFVPFLFSFLLRFSIFPSYQFSGKFSFT